MSIRKYSLNRDGNLKLSANFRVREFKCNDGSDTIYIADELVEILQKIREKFDKVVIINSAYRTKAYNKKVGGVSSSQHLLGTAADIYINGVEPIEIAKYVEFLMPKSGGIGLYNTFVHIDVRESRSRWNSTSGTEKSVSGFSGYQATSWEKAVAKGIFDGTNSTEVMTREQCAVVLDKLGLLD